MFFWQFFVIQLGEFIITLNNFVQNWYLGILGILGQKDFFLLIFQINVSHFLLYFSEDVKNKYC